METYTFDASKEPLGRIATKIAVLLMGKHRPSFEHHRKEAVRVVVTNSNRIQLSGRKWKQKMYYRHSGYLGNLKSLSAEWMLGRDSRRLIYLAVWGMLPKNKLRKQLIRNMVIYKNEAAKETRN